MNILRSYLIMSYQLYFFLKSNAVNSIFILIPFVRVGEVNNKKINNNKTFDTWVCRWGFSSFGAFEKLKKYSKEQGYHTLFSIIQDLNFKSIAAFEKHFLSLILKEKPVSSSSLNVSTITTSKSGLLSESERSRLVKIGEETIKAVDVVDAELKKNKWRKVKKS